MADVGGVNIITVLLALSGWGKVAYDYAMARPMIRGKILNVMRGYMPNPQQPTQQLTAFFVYLYLTNARRAPVEILSYELHIFARGDWHRIQPVYGAHQMKDPTFVAANGGKIEIQNFAGNLINRKSSPIDFGKPLHGWHMFAGAKWMHSVPIDVFKVVCHDVLDGRHEVEVRPGEFPDLYLLQDIAGISFPAGMPFTPPGNAPSA